uniref:Rho-GAP domain-containing protein n=1 Tax=Macrostomum lignano TaxID=282301 RepID=A0A1I8F9Z3_9PLAT
CSARLHPGLASVNPISGGLRLERTAGPAESWSEHQQHHSAHSSSSLRAEFSDAKSFQRRAQAVARRQPDRSEPDVSDRDDGRHDDRPMMSSPTSEDRRQPGANSSSSSRPAEAERASSVADFFPVLKKLPAGGSPADAPIVPRCSLDAPPPASTSFVTFARAFYEICRVNLAFVTDVPADFLQTSSTRARRRSLAAPDRRRRREGRHRLRAVLLVRVCRPSGSTAVQTPKGCIAEPDLLQALKAICLGLSPLAASKRRLLNADILTSSAQLIIHCWMSRLERRGQSSASPASVSRQRQLRRRSVSRPRSRTCRPVSPVAEAVVSELGLLRGTTVAECEGLPGRLEAAGRCSLTELGPYFWQVAAGAGNLNPPTPGRERNPLCPLRNLGGSVSLAAARQLRVFQILVQLLPHSNRWMLSSLLKLLGQVAELPRTLMTPENLGTVFGPLLLCRDRWRSYYAAVQAMPESAKKVGAGSKVQRRRQFRRCRSDDGGARPLTAAAPLLDAVRADGRHSRRRLCGQ